LTEAITALAAISARHAAGKVQSPGGLLRKMVELHQAGGLRLDRTLFGLADRLRNKKGSSNGVQS
jgi:replication initiation protein RepC